MPQKEKKKQKQQQKKKKKKKKTKKKTNKQKKKTTKKNNIFFTNYHKQLMAPFVIYADFECITVHIKEKHGKQTVAYQEHKACGYGYKIVCKYDDKYSKPTKIYRGPDAVYKMIENLLEKEKEIQEIIKQNFNKEMIISEKKKKKKKKKKILKMLKHVIYVTKSTKKLMPVHGITVM